MSNLLDFKFSTMGEICQELGARLKVARLSQGLLQAELAARAGVSRGTVKTLENSGQSTVASLVRIVQTLGLEGELQNLFVAQIRSIADLERNEASHRQRASRKQHNANKADPS